MAAHGDRSPDGARPADENAPIDDEPTDRRGAAGARAVRVHATSPGRTVFTEDGNSDGWIATDLTVDLDR